MTPDVTVKVVAAFNRNPALSREEFSSYYEEHHAALFRTKTPPAILAGIPHYVQNVAIELGGAGAQPPYDCVTELGFTDEAALRAWNDWYFGPEGKVLRDDEEHFMDKASRVIIVTAPRHP
ncbi:MAG: EthD family reductase [Actinobacteria bacterium]|nr:EthD family reductase [Actinomycetota bacterium]